MVLPPGHERRHTPSSNPAALGSIHWTLQEHNETWFRELVEHSQDVLAVHDLEGHLLAVNPTAARLTGYTAAELLKIPLRELIAQEFHAKFDDYLKQVRTTRESRGFMAVVTRSGQRRIFEYRATLSQPGKNPAVVHCVAHDITAFMQEQRALRASNAALRQKSEEQERLLRDLQLFRALLDNSNDAVQVVEPVTLRLLDVNQRTCLDLGYTREELLKMTVFDISPGYTEKHREAVMEQIKASGSATIERLHRRKDGSTFPAEVTIREAHLDRTYGVVVARNITRRKQNEQAIRQREADLNRAQSVAHIGSWRFDILQQSVSFSDETYRIIGLPIGSPLTPLTAQDRIHQDDVAKLLAGCQQALASGAFDAEHRIWREGQLRWVRTRAQFEYNAQGNPVLAVGTVQDITESKRASQLLAEQEQRFHAMFDRSPVGIALTETASGRLLQVNAKYCEIVGRDSADLLRLDFQSITHPDDLGHELEFVRQFAAREIAYFELEKRYLRPDGSIRWAKIVVVPAWSEEATPTTHLAMVKDITARRQAEQALQASEERFREMADNTLEAFWLLDAPTGKLLYMSPAYERLTGRPCASLYDAPYAFLPEVHPDDRERLRERLSSPPQHGILEGEFRMLLPDGRLRWVMGRAFPVRDPQGNLKRISGVCWDVTARKIREARLQEFERVVESLDEMILVIDRDYRYVLANRAYLQWRGMSREQVIGHHVAENLGQEFFQNVIRQRMDQAFAGQTSRFEVKYSDPRLGERDGITSYIPVAGSSGIDRIACILQDVTERKQAELRLREFERVVESAEEMILTIDRDYRYAMVNPAFLRYWDKAIDRVVGRPVAEVVPAEIFENLFKPRLEECFQGKIVHYEHSICYPGMGQRDMAITYSPVEGPTGIERAACVVRDITDRKLAEHALRLSEARERARSRELETVLETIPVAVCIARDSDCSRLTGNRAAYQQLGVAPGSNISRSAPAGESPAFRVLENGVEIAADALPIQQSASTGRPIFNRPLTILLPDGSRKETITNVVPLFDDEGRPRGAVAASIDVTELKQAEQALLQSEQRYRLLYEKSPLGVAVIDSKTGRFLQVNPRSCELVGRTREELLQLTSDDITHPEDLIQNSHYRHAAGGPPAAREFEKRFVLPDGSIRWVKVLAAPLWDEGDSPGSFISLAQDITELKQAQVALRQSEERFRLALAGSPTKVFNQNRDLRYTWVYNLQEGWTEKDYLGKTDEEIFGPEAGAIMTAIKRPVLETGQRTRQEFVLDARGKKYYCDITVEPLHDASGAVTGVNCACIDVTHLHEIAEELRLAKEKLSEEKLYLEQSIVNELGFGEIVGRSAALRALMDKVAKVAPSTATVLLLGETGTGKELVARAIHRMSLRAGQPFIKLNCAAIPSGLLESELFGHEKGAFTGAVAKKIGRLELAGNGTLFLDEIGEIPLDLQPKLLRVLQDHEFERLGGTQTIKVDFRLVAATNRDLWQSVTQRQFRSDLYYRLHVFPIHTPPLRDRREDIPLLVEHFVKKTAAYMGKSITSIPSKAMEALMQCAWPGNIRELENFVERSVILSPGSVLQVPFAELSLERSSSKSESLDEMERERILQALRECHGKLAGPNGAAARLGLKRTTLQSRLTQLGINPAAFRRPS